MKFYFYIYVHDSFEFIVLKVWGLGQGSPLCLWISNCSSIIGWKSYPSFIELHLFLCHKLAGFIYVGLFSDSLFCFINPCVYPSTITTARFTNCNYLQALISGSVIPPPLFFFLKTHNQVFKYLALTQSLNTSTVCLSKYSTSKYSLPKTWNSITGAERMKEWKSLILC